MIFIQKKQAGRRITKRGIIGLPGAHRGYQIKQAGKRTVSLRQQNEMGVIRFCYKENKNTNFQFFTIIAMLLLTTIHLGKGKIIMRKVQPNEAAAYNAPGHFDMRAIRLHSKEESGCENFTLGLSHFLPGGGTEYVKPPVELIYFILEGEMTVSDQDGKEICTLRKYDSMHFDAGEGKSILNKTNYPASMLVIASMLPAK